MLMAIGVLLLIAVLSAPLASDADKAASKAAIKRIEPYALWVAIILFALLFIPLFS